MDAAAREHESGVLSMLDVVAGRHDATHASWRAPGTGGGGVVSGGLGVLCTHGVVDKRQRTANQIQLVSHLHEDLQQRHAAAQEGSHSAVTHPHVLHTQLPSLHAHVTLCNQIHSVC